MDASDLAVLDLLYAALGDNDAWTQAITGMARLLHAGHAHFLAFSSSEEQPFLQTVGLCQADIERFGSARAWSLWKPYQGAMPRGRPVLQCELIRDDQFERCDFYNEIVRPTGGFFSVTVQQVAANSPYQLTFCRPRAGGEFASGEAERLKRLLPHLVAVFTLHNRLKLVEERSKGLANALNRLHDGVILIKGNGEIDFANGSLNDMLEDPSAWFFQARVVERVGAERKLRLREIVSEFQRRPLRQGRRVYGDDPSHPDHQLIIDIVSLVGFGLALPGLPAPQVAVFVRQTAAPLSLDKSSLMDIYHLTARESEIAVLLASGSAPATISVATGLTENTVRFYLKQIFAKTRTRTQASLVAALQPYVSQLR